MKKDKKIIGVVGFGKFGTLTASILSTFFDVRVYHYKKTLEYEKLARKIGVRLIELSELAECDVTILTVPISRTEEMIKTVAPHLKKGSLLVDACSVKVLPCRWLKKYAPRDVEILGTHPMFGPVTTKFDIDKKYWELKDKQVVLCPLRTSEKTMKEIQKFLKSLEIEVIVTTPEDHDQQNAKSLSFVHFLGRSMMASGIVPQRIFTLGYADVLKILPHTNQDEWQLFFDMNNLNPYAEKVRQTFLMACDGVEDKIIKSNSVDDFDFNRQMINKIDAKLFELLKKRMKCSREIGKIKKKKGLPIFDKKREDDIVKTIVKRSGMDEKFVRDLYGVIFEESKRRQK